MTSGKSRDTAGSHIFGIHMDSANNQEPLVHIAEIWDQGVDY